MRALWHGQIRRTPRPDGRKLSRNGLVAWAGTGTLGRDITEWTRWLPNGGLGCDDATCETTICAADSFCCDTQWDQICADAALIDCAVCGA